MISRSQTPEGYQLYIILVYSREIVSMWLCVCDCVCGVTLCFDHGAFPSIGQGDITLVGRERLNIVGSVQFG
jgi:hypothetical protein